MKRLLITILGTGGMLLFLIAIAQIADISAHSSVRFHTGQTASYSGTAGEDGDVDGTSKSYTSDGCGSGTVLDNHTDLCWERDDRPVASSWQDAMDTCKSATTGSQDDWRLPTAYEAITMLDYSCPLSPLPPHCETDFGNDALNWANGASGDYWSSTTRPDTPASAYRVFAANGTLNGLTKTNTAVFVRCVRSAM